jgi:hypothetical protein
VSGNLDPWVEYVPDIVQDGPVATTRKARRLITPDVGDAFFVEGEYDDGNGMWIITGVSRDLSTD